MIIDSHQHLMFPNEFQIKKMNKAGVDKAILFSTTPHPEHSKTMDELKNEMKTLFKILDGSNTPEQNIKRFEKDIFELLKTLEKYPDKFYGFAPVPLGIGLENTVKWIEKYVISNSLKGIGEFTPGSEEQVYQLEPVFQALKHFPDLPVWIHTFHPVTSKGIKILANFALKYPKTPVIFGHMGGYNWMDTIDFAKNIPNIYIDLSAAFSTLAVRIAMSELPDKCLYSSDAPYGEPFLSKQLIEYLSPSEKITKKILGENILKLIKIK